ncbi:MAG: hypothetical protein P8J32_09050 [bacterium]|nr:hypothetical protein [bacterium]
MLKDITAFVLVYFLIVPVIFLTAVVFMIFFVLPVLTMETWSKSRKKSIY